MSEFDLIKRYFTNIGGNQFVRLGIGDDAAITTIPESHELVTTVDTLVADVHFYSDTAPELIGHKALAVNLSDLAAMAATPAWFTLSLSLPAKDEDWLRGFSKGIASLARLYDIALVGGDTVKGPLNITIQACGLVEKGMALLRSGARIGDAIYVTGELGDASLALSLIKDENRSLSDLGELLEQLHKPLPRVKQGLLLNGLATSAIDISDGLVADLSHILNASNVGGELILDSIPISDKARSVADEDGLLDKALYGGDDYELCFTVPQANEDALLNLMDEQGYKIYRIGHVVAGSGVLGIDGNGNTKILSAVGYDHFADVSS